MATVKSYRDLIVWQKAMDLASAVYRATSKFPKEEVYGITSQLRRASVSIAANIAEGQARNSTGEFKQHLGVAKGSLAELETLILLSKDFDYIDEFDCDSLLAKCTEKNKLLHGLLKSLPTKGSS